MGQLIEAVKVVQAHVKAVCGERMRATPDAPDPAMTVLPYSLCYAQRGEWEPASYCWGRGTHTIRLELHYAISDIARAHREGIPALERLCARLGTDPTLGGTVECVQRLAYSFGDLVYGGEQHVGPRIEIGVKTHEEE